MEFIEGKFGDKALRLGSTTLNIPLTLSGDYTIFLYRKLTTETNWDKIIKLSNGDIYVNGEINTSYDISWLNVDASGDITIDSTAKNIDELMTMDRLPTTEELIEWNSIDRPFYDVINQSNLSMPTSVSMEEI